jgi:type IV pilus assembly protein PilY1
VFRNLYKLADPAYTHQYFVDGTPTVIDAFFSGNWHTVLAAGLNKGGQGVFALDVTRPGNVSESNASNLLLWEFTDAEDADLGYTYSRPSIVRLHNGKWAAVFGNGYNNTDTDGGADTHVSTTGNGVLFIVDIETGALIRKIDTGVGMAQDPKAQSRPNGLASPTLIDLNGDGIVDYAYAGDLFGNLWKFDLTDASPANWDIAYSSGGTPLPLFKAVNSAGVPQAITERPQVSRGPRGIGAVVLFGTGKFLETNDRDVSTLSTQSFYGLYDRMTGVAATDVVNSNRNSLVEQTILAETSATLNGKAVSARVTSDNTVDPTAKNGWYIDLVSPSSGFQGEMQVSDPVLRDGQVIFTTLIPDPDICAFGGRSWLMNLNAITGERMTFSPYDFNGDKAFNAADLISVVINGNSVSVPASGVSGDAIMQRPGVAAKPEIDDGTNPPSGSCGGGGAVGAVPLSDANTETIDLCFGPGASGRQSWRQVR